MPEDKKQESADRKLALEQAMFKAVNETSAQVKGDFTVFEIVDVMSKVMHNYNKIGLEQQYKDYEPIESDSKVKKLKTDA